MGIILFLIALILIFLLTFVNYWYVENKKGYFRSTAMNLDIFANREFRAFWNAVLTTDAGYQFGKEGETLSSALGKNVQRKALTKTGRRLVWVLSEAHCIDAIIN